MVTLILAALVLCTAAYYFRTVATGELDRKLLAKMTDEQVAQRAGESKPEFEAVMEWGRRLETAAKLEEAQRVYGRAVELRPEVARAWSSWGRVTFATGDWKEAERILDRTVELFPDHPEGRFVRAALYGETERPEKAAEDLRIGLKRESKNAPGWRSLGDLEFEAKRWQVAADCYRKGLALEPKSVYLRRQLGACLTRLKQPKAALELIQSALKDNPADMEARYELALALVERGSDDDRAQALKEFNRVVTFSSDKSRPWVRVAEVWVREGNTGDAAQALEHAVDANPNDLEALKKLVEVYGMDKRVPEAKRFEQDVRRVEKIEARKEALLQAIKAGENLSTNLAALAKVRVELGDLQGARENLVSAANLDLSNPVPKKELARLNEAARKAAKRRKGGAIAPPQAL
jgi:tetratricopeptide (TPR) repeat protein